jgi:transcriptional regulator with XRE-family HTH domain
MGQASQVPRTPGKSTHRELSRRTKDYIGGRIRVLREVKGWDRAQLARQIEVEWNTLNKYEKGESTPGLAVLIGLVKAFGLSSLEELLGGTQVLILSEEEERGVEVSRADATLATFPP